MWIAEGFVHKNQGKSLFEIGEEYFNELVNKSMIHLVEEFMDQDSEGQGCQVHDMVLDLIRSISSEENFVTIVDSNEGASTSSQGKVHRLVQNNKSVEAYMDMQHVRSFISYGCNIDKGVPFTGFKLIRVLDIGTASSNDFESSHLEHLQYLLHLRYLRLHGDIYNLPEGIGDLKFLETLDVDGQKQVLPSVGHLTQLLCLRFRCWPWRVPDGIEKLTSLQELNIEYHDDSDQKVYSRFVKELDNLRELRVLCIRMSEMWLAPYQVESLRNLEKLEHLTLSTYPFTVDTAAWEAAGFLLSRRLRQLFLYNIEFSRFPSSCINPSRLPNLSHLNLSLHYIDEPDLRILGGLLELRYLYLDVYSTSEVACNTESTASDADASYLFQKLRRCTLQYFCVPVVTRKDDDSSGGSCSMFDMDASMLLGSQSGKGVAPTLMPSAQMLKFRVLVPEFMCICDSFSLEYFASVRNVSVQLECTGVSTAVVEKAEAALRHAADIHPNRPKLEVTKRVYKRTPTAEN
ncbi:unnamed protein product [Urochloa humidicola]